MSPTTAKSTKPAGEQPAVPEAEDGRFSIKPLLKLMAEKKASDLFFTSNSPVKIKIEGLRGDDAINALLDKKSGDSTTGAFKIQGGAVGKVTPLRKR